MGHRCVILLLGVWLTASCAWGFTAPATLEEMVGETLHFKVYWTGIPAAKASLSVYRSETDYMLRAKADGLKVIQWIYPVKGRIWSRVRGPAIEPLKYTKSGREGWGKKRKREVLFNYERGVAEYYRDGELRKDTVEIEPGVQDPLSVFYRFRVSEIPKGSDSYEVEVSDGKKRITGSVRFLGRETIETPAGTFETIHVQPSLEGVGGVFAKSPDAEVHMWLSDDKWRRPVKMQSEVVVGHFTLLLVDIDPPISERPAPQSE